MIRILLGATALLVAVPAMAQLQSAPPVAPYAPVPLQQRMDVTQTRDQAVAKVRERFARMDINRDGFVNEVEMQSVRGDRQGKRRMGERRGGGRLALRERAMRDPSAAFDRLDVNRDGVISREEFGRARAVRDERLMVRGGTPGINGDRRAMRQDRQRLGGRGMGGGMMRMADLDRDGRVSLQEATTSAVQRFDRVDANRDGRITPEERRLQREQRRALRANRAG